MTASPDELIQTPQVLARGPPMDVTVDILSSMRLSGAVVFDVGLVAPWCVVSHYGPQDCARFFPVPVHLIAYHYVTEGQLWAQIGDEEPVLAEAGEVLLLPRNDRHLLFSEAGLPPRPIEEVTIDYAGGPMRVQQEGSGARMTMFCGYLGSTAAEPALMQNLPALMKVRVDGTRQQWTESSLELASGDLHDAPETVARMTELLFFEAVRRYIEDLPEGEGGWLAGLRDPSIAKALSIIHNRFAEALDVNSLAREVGMSRSAFADRFTALIGESPIRYCARWRMRVAANLLRDGRQSSGNVAYEVGFNSEAAFTRAFKREYGMPPATWRRINLQRPAPGDSDRPAQQVRFALARDGTRLAWSSTGEGPPLIKAANWLNHIQHDWNSPLWRHWMDELTCGHTLIRYDERGTGLSDWETPEISFEAFVDDLETVVDASGHARFDLLGISQGAAVSIAYAVRHPERVRKLVLVGGYALGWAVRDMPEEAARREAMITLTRSGWGMDNPAFRQMFTSLYIPGATPEQMDWFNEVQRLSASPEMAERLQRVLSTIDIRKLLPRLSVPTLVMHVRSDSVVPFAAGEGMAGQIPGARFVALDGANHILLRDEPAWAKFVEETRRFLAD